MKRFLLAMLILAPATLQMNAAALAQSGPVAASCKDDIQKFCAGKKHNGEIRACLTEQKDKVAPACKAALESTGPGRRRGGPAK